LHYQHNLYIAEKYIYWATILSQTLRVYIIHLAIVAFQNREIAVQGHPRSSILVSIESSYATSY